MTEAQMPSDLKPEVAKAIAKSVFSYGEPRKLDEGQLLTVARLIVPYTTVDDRVRSALLTVEQFLTTTAVVKEAAERTNSVWQRVNAAVGAWNSAIRDMLHESMREQERRRHNEDLPHQELLYKKMHHLDGRELAMELVRLLEERDARPAPGLPVNFPPPPPLTVPPELIAWEKELAEKGSEKLLPLVEEVAAAKQTLSEFVYAFVAAHDVRPSKD